MALSAAWGCGDYMYPNKKPLGAADFESNAPAGREGFEPSDEVYSPINRLAGGPNQPLWHLPERIVDCRLLICDR
jgi:hypothetical protein